MPGHIALTLIGGPTVLIELDGVRLLTDPTFDAPGSYPGAVTLEKTSSPALDPGALGRIDAVLLSHDQHKDNLDTAGRALLPHAGLTLTTPIGAQRLGLGIGLAPWESHTLTGPYGALLTVTATPARHGPVGIEPIAGDVVGFVVESQASGRSIYISGDTVWYEGVAEVARRFKPDLLVLFTGSAKTRGPIHLTMDANDAIEAAHAFPGARVALVHNEGWAHFTESGPEVEAAYRLLGLGDRLVALTPGVPARV